jgi:hypothetical protein
MFCNQSDFFFCTQDMTPTVAENQHDTHPDGSERK